MLALRDRDGMTMNKLIAASAGLALLTGCNAQPGSDQTEPDPAEASPSVEAPVSILRPDVQQPDLPPPALEPLNAIIGFPDGGAELDANAMAALEQVLASEQLATDAPIALHAHSDSDEPDQADEDISQARGLVVADWLIDKGIDQDRIEVIVFGGQNPVEPNALPNGSPNEAGRAANRRVEVVVVPPTADTAEVANSEPAAEASDAVGD